MLNKYQNEDKIINMTYVFTSNEMNLIKTNHEVVTHESMGIFFLKIVCNENIVKNMTLGTFI